MFSLNKLGGGGHPPARQPPPRPSVRTDFIPQPPDGGRFQSLIVAAQRMGDFAMRVRGNDTVYFHPYVGDGGSVSVLVTLAQGGTELFFCSQGLKLPDTTHPSFGLYLLTKSGTHGAWRAREDGGDVVVDVFTTRSLTTATPRRCVTSCR